MKDAPLTPPLCSTDAVLATLPAGAGDLPGAMIVWEGALYIGTAPGAGEGGHARILRLPWPGGGAVEPVYEGPEGSAVTGFAALDGSSDAGPALYAALAAPGGGLILQAKAGAGAFAPVTEPGLGEAARRWIGPLALWGGRLVAAAGRAAPLVGAIGSAELLIEADDGSGTWAALSEPGFGDPGNVAISLLTVLDGTLLAGTVNPARGFQLWQAGEDGAWEQRIVDGAHRHVASPALTACAAGEGELLLGSGGAAPTAADLPADAQPPELLGLDPATGWELIAGEPRFTPEGFKVPAALEGPGFGWVKTARICAILRDGATITAVLAATPQSARPFGLPEPGAARIWRSEDAGETFVEAAALPHPLVAAAAFDEGLLLAGLAGGKVRLRVAT